MMQEIMIPARLRGRKEMHWQALPTERQIKINPTRILRLKGLHQTVHIVSVRENKLYIGWSDVRSSRQRRLRVSLIPTQT
jgi:hypothetical protein